MILSTLYKRTSTGAIQQWGIRTDSNVITTTYGQVNGKLQTAQVTIAEGKNIGKVNETTPEEQAEFEAVAQWELKRNKHYVLRPDDALNGLVDLDVIQGGVVPMLAHVYSKHGSKIRFPAAVQPKLDGHRCIAILRNGKATLWTRTQKPITSVPHVIDALERLGLEDVIFDGELYNHDYRDRFEELSSFIRNSTPKPGHEVVQYHIYDLVGPGQFFERDEIRYDYLEDAPYCLVDVATYVVKDEDEMIVRFKEFTADGYEGLMVRNYDSLYVGKRSYDLLKVKEFDDSEYMVVGVDQGRGKMEGKGIFVCQTPDGNMFKTKMVGSIDALSHAYEHPEKYIGRMLTVKYQGLTNENNVPRFPIGIRFRDDI